jgi:hypothetical protein
MKEMVGLGRVKHPKRGLGNLSPGDGRENHLNRSLTCADLRGATPKQIYRPAAVGSPHLFDSASCRSLFSLDIPPKYSAGFSQWNEGSPPGLTRLYICRNFSGTRESSTARRFALRAYARPRGAGMLYHGKSLIDHPFGTNRESAKGLPSGGSEACPQTNAMRPHSRQARNRFKLNEPDSDLYASWPMV